MGQQVGVYVYSVTLTCDVCDHREHFASAFGEADLEQLIAAHGWTRFGPSGSDLCFKCRGSSPNTIIQVKK